MEVTGATVQLNTSDGKMDAYVAQPKDGGSYPGVVVIQECWGLVPHIVDVADRFAAAGITALAPDLYRGATTTEPDGAGKLMMALNLDRAARDLSGAVDLLRERTGRDAVGTVGYCMGGGLALVLACHRPDAVKAVAPYYGVIPWPTAQPDWSALDAKVVGEYAELDEFAGPEVTRALESQLRDLGKDATMHIHDGCHHAFFNDTRPEVYDAEHSAEAFGRTVGLFRSVL